MKKAICTVTLILAVLPLFAGDLKIIITGIDTDRRGNILVAVYPGKKGFMDREQIIWKAMLPADSSQLEFIAKDLPDGEYTFAVVHDENENFEMDKKGIMPKEGFAFSGKDQPVSRPPKYKNAYIALSGGMLESEAAMSYY